MRTQDRIIYITLWPISNFQHTEILERSAIRENGMVTWPNGSCKRIRASDPCLTKAVRSTSANVKSTTYAHRSHAYVTDCDWSGHISVTLWSQWSSRKRNSILAVPSIRDFSGTIHSPFKVIEGITHTKVERDSSVSSLVSNVIQPFPSHRFIRFSFLRISRGI